MSSKDFPDLFDEFDSDEQQNYQTKTSKRRLRKSSLQTKKPTSAMNDFIRNQDDSRLNFQFTYKAARFEEWWLLDSLGDFYEHKWISDVLTRVKGGKEASVYLCRSDSLEGTRLTAAKVYRPRSLRNLKNDGQYRNGRARP